MSVFFLLHAGLLSGSPDDLPLGALAAVDFLCPVRTSLQDVTFLGAKPLPISTMLFSQIFTAVICILHLKINLCCVHFSLQIPH